MSRWTRILVACGGRDEEAAARLAAGLLAPGGRLLLHDLTGRPARLSGLAERLGVAAEVAGAEPGQRPYVALVRQAADSGAELLVKLAEPSPRPSIPLFASLDQHLLRKCPCPIWLLRDGLVPPAQVVAAVDLPASEVARDEAEAVDGLNRTILVTAARLAAGGGRAVRVLHAWEDPDAGLIAQWSSGGVDARLEQSAEATARARQAALGKLLQRARLWLDAEGLEKVELAPLLVPGPARQAVPQAVAELGADLLVLGTLARTGVAGVLIGNTAEDVLNAVDCDVAAVKPPGYVSPLLA